MNKFYGVFLMTILCLMTQDAIASEGSKEQKKVFFDKASINRFKHVAQGYGYIYLVPWGALNIHNVCQILIHKDQDLMHRKWTFMPEEYGKYAPQSSKIMNVLRGNNVICKTLLKTMPKSLPTALVIAFLYDGYNRGF